MEPKRNLSNSIYWVEVDRIKPNPFQPRKEFDEAALKSLAESIRQYGVLQPLTVTKKESEIPGEGIKVEYELIAGERRLRASKIAGVGSVPCVIRVGEQGNQEKLELAIIENLQREDLNPVDRAKAFKQLADEFGQTHEVIGKRVGKSRVYVSNTLRILNLPQDMLDALSAGEIVEGHTRPLLMLADRVEQQKTLFQEILTKRLNVRDSEQIARRIALERARKTDLTPELMEIEKTLSEKLGTRVRIEKSNGGVGKVTIEFFSNEDLTHIQNAIAQPLASAEAAPIAQAEVPAATPSEVAENPEVAPQAEAPKAEEKAMEAAPEQDLYSVKNFTV